MQWTCRGRRIDIDCPYLQNAARPAPPLLQSDFRRRRSRKVALSPPLASGSVQSAAVRTAEQQVFNIWQGRVQAGYQWEVSAWAIYSYFACRHDLDCRCSQSHEAASQRSFAPDLDTLSRRALLATAAVVAQLQVRPSQNRSAAKNRHFHPSPSMFQISQDRAAEAASSKGGGSAILAGGATTLSNSGSVVKLSPSERQVGRSTLDC